MHPQDAPAGREQPAVAAPPPGSGASPPPARPGFIKRAPAFAEHLRRAAGYAHDPRLTKLALVRDLALGCPELSDAAFRQAVVLLLLIPPAAWERGELLVHLGNRLLCSRLGASETALRRSGRELEEAGLVLRHLDAANHPAAGRRFDLRPLAARHGELSAGIAEAFAAHRRARAERRHCPTAPAAPAEDTPAESAPIGGATAESVSEESVPAERAAAESAPAAAQPPGAPPESAAPPEPAAAGTYPPHPPPPAGGAAGCGAPRDTGTGEDPPGEPVRGQPVEAGDNSAAAPRPAAAPRAPFRTGPSRPRPGARSPQAAPPRSGYWRPTDPTPPPRSLTGAAALLAGVSPDFAIALGQCARDPAAPSLEELLDAADRLREFLRVPRSVWTDSHGRLDRLERVAILVAAMAKPQADFRSSRTAWARSLLSRQRGEVDIWATIQKLQAARGRLH